MSKLAEQPSDTDIPLGTLLDRTTLLKYKPVEWGSPTEKTPTRGAGPNGRTAPTTARFAKGGGPRNFRVVGKLQWRGHARRLPPGKPGSVLSSSECRRSL